MSRSVDLFLDSPLELGELARRLGSVTDLTFTPEADGSGWITRTGQVVARLGPHHYVDDGDLLLSQYRYALSCRVGNDGRLTDSAEVDLMRRVLYILRNRTPLKLLLVLDLQYRDHPAEAGLPDQARTPAAGNPPPSADLSTGAGSLDDARPPAEEGSSDDGLPVRQDPFLEDGSPAWLRAGR